MRRIALSRSSPDEFLYGRSGYLSTLFFLRRELGDQCIDDSLITEVTYTPCFSLDKCQKMYFS